MPKVEVSPQTTEQDYIRTLITADTLAQLRANLLPWARFCPEALNVADRMGEREFRDWRAGFLAIVNRPEGAGEPTQAFMAAYGDLTMPPSLMDASQKAEHHDTTLGVVLLAVWSN